jgi:hypothetical protein
VYDRACIHSLAEALQCCNRIGYPVMLKASWGGGGKGIRKVGGAGKRGGGDGRGGGLSRFGGVQRDQESQAVLASSLL